MLPIALRHVLDFVFDTFEAWENLAGARLSIRHVSDPIPEPLVGDAAPIF